MDQDSIFVDFKQYLKNTIYNDDCPIGLYGPMYFSDRPMAGISEVHATITSGMLIKLELLNEIRGWNEFFAIDCVDDEFCIRAKRAGIKTFLIGESLLVQRLGSNKKKSFMNRTYILREDSPKRLYSIYKNHVVLIRLFPDVQQLRHDFFHYWIRIAIYVVLFENQKIKKTISIFRGVFSGLFCSLQLARRDI